MLKIIKVGVSSVSTAVLAVIILKFYFSESVKNGLSTKSVVENACVGNDSWHDFWKHLKHSCKARHFPVIYCFAGAHPGLELMTFVEIVLFVIVRMSQVQQTDDQKTSRGKQINFNYK